MGRGRKKKSEIVERRQRMIDKAFPLLIAGKVVTYEHVKEIYQEYGNHGRDEFRKDVKELFRLVSTAGKIYERLGNYLCKFEFDKKRNWFKVSIRPFARRLSEVLSSKETRVRQHLACTLIHTIHEGRHLVSREGALFLGFGTTLRLIAEEILRHPEFQGSIHTVNFEILALCGLVAHDQFDQNGRELHVHGFKKNWPAGSLVPADPNTRYSTAIVSFDSMKADGRLFTSSEEDALPTMAAMAAAVQRLILVGDSSKIGKDVDGPELLLPDLEGIELFFVTDAPLPEGFVPPAGATLIVLLPPKEDHSAPGPAAE